MGFFCSCNTGYKSRYRTRVPICRTFGFNSAAEKASWRLQNTAESSSGFAPNPAVVGRELRFPLPLSALRPSDIKTLLTPLLLFSHSHTGTDYHSFVSYRFPFAAAELDKLPRSRTEVRPSVLSLPTRWTSPLSLASAAPRHTPRRAALQLTTPQWKPSTATFTRHRGR